MQYDPTSSDTRPITPRELQVISLVAKGLTNKEVADELGIQLQTVKNYLGRITVKLGISSRLEIGLYAVKHHLHMRPPSTERPISWTSLQ